MKNNILKFLEKRSFSFHFRPETDRRFLVLGANGRLGHRLVRELNVHYGAKNVIAADNFALNEEEQKLFRFGCDFEFVDVQDRQQLEDLVAEKKANFIIHNALQTKLIAPESHKVSKLMSDNICSSQNVLDVAKKFDAKVLFLHRWAHSEAPAPKQALGIANHVCAMMGRVHAENGVDVRQAYLPAILHNRKSLK